MIGDNDSSIFVCQCFHSKIERDSSDSFLQSLIITVLHGKTKQRAAQKKVKGPCVTPQTESTALASSCGQRRFYVVQAGGEEMTLPITWNNVFNQRVAAFSFHHPGVNFSSYKERVVNQPERHGTAFKGVS